MIVKRVFIAALSMLIACVAAPVSAAVNPLAASMAKGTSQPDPSLEGPLDCVRTQNVRYSVAPWGTLQARIYWASGDNCWTGQFGPFANSPVVLLLHGNGYLHTEYSYLANHLATHGFVVVSAESSNVSPTIYCNGGGANCIEDRARKATTLLDTVRTKWAYAAQASFKNVSVVGHSQGGEAAVKAAQIIRSEYPLIGNPGVAAVVSLAPTNRGPWWGGEYLAIGGDDAKSFLVLYGSRDEDVQPQKVAWSGLNFEPPAPVVSTGFALYDQAGTENSMEGAPISQHAQITKSMQFLYGANHLQFSDRSGHKWTANGDLLGANCNSPEFTAISSLDQKRAAKGYVGGFLRWFQKGDDYRQWFDGSIQHPFTAAYPQFSPGRQWGERRVIDNFQHEGWTSTIGGDVTQAGFAFEHEIVSMQDELMSLHGPADGSGRRLAITMPDNLAECCGTMSWEIPANKRDWSGFTHLSVRVGQGYKEFFVPLEAIAGIAQVWFRVKSAGQWSLGGASGDVPSPDKYGSHQIFCPVLGQLEPRWTSHMRTIQIPLEQFGVPLDQIEELQIGFGANSTFGKRLYIDNIELTGGGPVFAP